MRLFCLIFLVAFLALIGVFAYSNQQIVKVYLLERDLMDLSMAAVAGIFYVLGMFSGWTVVGMVRRSFNKVTERPVPGEYSHSR